MSERLLFCACAPFEAARHLPQAASAQRRRLHGHGFLARLRAGAPGAMTAAPFAGAETDALRAALQEAVALLDYQLLNEQIELPTDENLARWIRARLGLGTIELLGVASTPRQGVDLDRDDRAHAWRRYQFESAHRLPRVAPGHPCGRLHGHGFAVIVHADAPPGAPAIAGEALDALWAPLQARLHHACLNDIPGLDNPTSEWIARWIWDRLHPQLAALRWVTVYETATCGAHFDGSHFRIWKELGFDSAVRLSCAPAGDRRQGVHGHSYRLRLHLAAPLDEVMGWTIDFGDVKQLFAPIYVRLDHQPLHEIAGVAQAGSAGLLRWVRGQAAGLLPSLQRIDLYETPGCGATLAWGHEPPALPV